MRFLISSVFLAPVVILLTGMAHAETPTPAADPAPKVKASGARCEVAARLVEAKHKHRGKPDKKNVADPSEKESEEEREQLKTLPYGSFETLSVQRSEVAIGETGTLELPQRGGAPFRVKVTPHSFADNKVHYTVQWTTPVETSGTLRQTQGEAAGRSTEKRGEESVVATRLGVENGRSIMLGTDTLEGPKKRCLVVGIKVRCSKSESAGAAK